MDLISVNDQDHTGHHLVEIYQVQTDTLGVAKTFYCIWCVDDEVLIEYQIKEAE